MKKISTAELPDNSKILLVDDLSIAARDVQLLQVKSQLDKLKKGMDTQIIVNDLYFQSREAKREIKKMEWMWN